MATRNDKRFPALMKRLIRYFLIIIVLMVALNAFFMYSFNIFYNDFQKMLKFMVDTHSITLMVDNLHICIDNYINSGNNDYLEEYQSNYDRLLNELNVLQNNSVNTDFYYRYYDIKNMTITFNTKCYNVRTGYNDDIPVIYLNQYVAEMTRYKNYIQEEVKRLLLVQLTSVQSYYSSFGDQISYVGKLTILLTFFITAVGRYFAIRFSKQIAAPIYQLAVRLRRAAKGDFSMQQLKIKTKDEINVLVDSFNFMIAELNQLFKRTEEKANVERQLQEQEIKNLEMSNLLKESELNFLQSQINPHFLFNTFNSISALADIERAVQTRMMIDSLSVLLRYNMSRKSNITLEEEYEIVRNYLYIQAVRFGNRIKFTTHVDEELLSITVPSMIIQPFVENSIIHGLEPKEGEGCLTLDISKKNGGIEISISDDGIGISEEKLDEILDDREGADSSYYIGIKNVMRRLELHYGYCPIKIASRQNEGTQIKIQLPAPS